MKNDHLMAVANGKQVKIIHSNGATYSNIPTTGNVVSSPAISGDRVSFVVERSGGRKELHVHKLSGPRLSSKSI